jgi:hypothetical protein
MRTHNCLVRCFLHIHAKAAPQPIKTHSVVPVIEITAMNLFCRYGYAAIIARQRIAKGNAVHAEIGPPAVAIDSAFTMPSYGPIIVARINHHTSRYPCEKRAAPVIPVSVASNEAPAIVIQIGANFIIRCFMRIYDTERQR